VFEGEGLSAFGALPGKPDQVFAVRPEMTMARLVGFVACQLNFLTDFDV
jgi:hypothetical protein